MKLAHYEPHHRRKIKGAQHRIKYWQFLGCGIAVVTGIFIYVELVVMQFVVHALDKRDALERRHAALSKHREFLDVGPETYGVSVLMSGPLSSDDGEKMIGSFFLLSAQSRNQVEAMFEADPLAAANVWERLDISRVTIRQNNVGTISENG